MEIRDMSEMEIKVANVLRGMITVDQTGAINGMADAGLEISKCITETLLESVKELDAARIKEKIQIHSDVKRILSHNFGKERNKQRNTDPEKNKVLLNELGSAFTVIESEVKDDLREYLIDGKDIFSIVPKRDHEKDEEAE